MVESLIKLIKLIKLREMKRFRQPVNSINLFNTSTTSTNITQDIMGARGQLILSCFKRKRAAVACCPFDEVTNSVSLRVIAALRLRRHFRLQVPGVERVDAVRETSKSSPLNLNVPPDAIFGTPCHS